MNSMHDVSETEEYYSIDEPRTERMLAAIVLLLAPGPIACGNMFGSMWASTNGTQINRLYDAAEVLWAGIFLPGPFVLLVANRMHRWLRHGTLRWMIVALQWVTIGIFAVHLSHPWRTVVISSWQSNDCTLIEHPAFATCFYISALLSCILWITFRGDRRWFLRALYEILPFVLITAGLYYLSIAERPELICG
jgi:hypothetical protein